MLENALKIETENLGKDSPSVGLTKYNLGAVLTGFGDKNHLVEARKHFETSKDIYLKHFGKEYYVLNNVQSWLEEMDQKVKGIGEG